MQRSFRLHIIQAEVKNRCISFSIAMLRPEKGLNRSTQKGIFLNFLAANAQLRGGGSRFSTNIVISTDMASFIYIESI